MSKNLELGLLGQSVTVNATSNAVTFNSNVTIANTYSVIFSVNSSIYANGTTGTSGQVLTSNGTTVYWSTAAGGSTNVDAQYTWTNTQTFSNTITFSQTINGTANNATYAYGKTESNLNVNSALTSNNSTYAFGKTESELNVNSALIANNSTNLGGVSASGYQTTAGLAANVAILAANSATYVLANSGIVSNSTGVFVNGNTGLVVNSGGVYVNSSYIETLTANNATYAFSKSEIDLNVNSALTSNNSTYAFGKSEVNLNVNSALVANDSSFLGGVAAADYQTEAGLAANVATLAANSATYVLANSGIVSNSSGVFVDGNTGLVVNSVGVHVNATYISTLTANNANNLNGIAAASYVQNTDSRTLSGNLYFTGANNTFSSNLTVEATGELIIAPGAGIYANGGLGTSGQVLTSNATSIYWSTVSGGGGVNTADQYSWTNNHTFNANLTIAATGELIVTAGAGIYANGGLGTSGQYLTSNGSSIYWSTASGGGATLSSNTTSATTHYPAMSTTSTGSWTSAIVSTTKLYFTPSTGQLNATIFNSLSDERVKKNIQTIENALATVNSIRGVRFDWKENDISSIGLIAQEIEQYLPELVHTSNEGEKSVNYGGVVGVLIEAIKELTARIEKLEGK